jgi:hypothetical protein
MKSWRPAFYIDVNSKFLVFVNCNYVRVGLTGVLPRSNYKTEEFDSIYISYNDMFKCKRNQVLNVLYKIY